MRHASSRDDATPADAPADPAPALERRESLDSLLKAIHADPAHDGTLLGTGGPIDEAMRLFRAVPGAWAIEFPFVQYSDRALFNWLAVQGITPAQAERMTLADVVTMLQAPESETHDPGAKSLPAPEPQEGRGRKPSVNSLVLDLLQRHPESHDWTARRIANAIGRGKTAVADCQAYKELDTAREMARLQRERKAQEGNERRGRNRTR